MQDVQIPSQYTKFTVALVAAALTAFIAINGSGSGLFIGLTIAIAIAQAAVTAAARNADAGFWHYAKFWANVAGVILQAILSLVGPALGLASISPVEWAGVALAAISALGVITLPNLPMIDARDSNDISSLPARKAL